VIFRRSFDEQLALFRPPGIRPAFPIFLELQNLLEAPRTVILQPDHSRLAAEIAQHLRPEIFGELPPEVLGAIREHDFGWERSDRNQLALVANRPLRPFPRLSPEETHPSWRESVRRARDSSPLKGVIVSRHFCALASQDPANRPFADEENPRREQIERDLKLAREDLDRWTAAIGFCDLVSLYLCCGSREPAEFPLAHSSLPAARDARKVVLEWKGEHPRFSSPVVKQGGTAGVKAWERVEGQPELWPVALQWQFLE
jgi:hypothetical protein